MHARTARQREVLDFIIRYLDSHGFRPSYQLIANHLGVRSRAGIARIVQDLESQGLLTRRRENGHFSIDVGASDSTVPIFWLDGPEAVSDDQSASMSIPELMLGEYDAGTVRAFIVPDDALAGEGISVDDIALIELREFARDGQIVAALIDKKEIVLRKYYRAGADIELRASNDENDSNSIRISADRVTICGIQRGILRPMV